jgi:hypothetical protein
MKIIKNTLKISKNTLLQQQIICFTPRVKARSACSRAWALGDTSHKTFNGEVNHDHSNSPTGRYQ